MAIAIAADYTLILNLQSGAVLAMTNTDLGLEVIPQRPPSKSRDGLIFVTAMWFLSRSVIAIADYIWAAFWGSLTTAIRDFGVAFIPAFLLVAWREKRPPLACVAGFASAIGLFSFSLYCTVRFGNGLAFVRGQKGWVQPGWFNIWSKALTLQISAISRILMIFGSGYLLWFFRKRLTSIVLTYGFCSLALLVNAGALKSVNRYACGIVVLSIPLGWLLAAKPRCGYGLMGLFGVFLLYVSVRFASWLWVA